MTVFDHLCETFPDENCVLTNREVLVEVNIIFPPSLQLDTYKIEAVNIKLMQ